MFARVLAPVPLAIAVAVGSAFTGPLTPAALAAPAAARQDAVRQFTLSTGMADGKMVFLDEKGAPNPTLQAKVGDTVQISIRSGEGAEHDIVFPDLKAKSPNFSAGSGPVKLSFKVDKPGRFTYYCTIAGHRQVGM